jgi:uncharacterized protein (TIRG00374 family)
MKSPRVWLGILVSVAATALLFYVVDVREVAVALGQANPWLALLCLLSVVASMWIKAYRWRLFFPEPDKIRLEGLLEALYIGYMVNTVLPLRAGEVVRAFVAAEIERVSKSTTLATVLIEKVLDLGTMALLLALLGLIFPDLPDSARYAAFLAGIGLVVATAGVAFALAARRQALALAGWFERKIPPLARIGVAGLLDAFLDGLAFARRPAVLVQVIIWSIVQWTMAGFTVALAMLSVGITGSSLYELTMMTLLVLVATNLSMAIPSAPGYVGVFHGVFVATLALFNVREDTATAAAVVEHVLVFGLFIVGGAYYLLRGEAARGGGRRLGELVTRAQSAANEAH